MTTFFPTQPEPGAMEFLPEVKGGWTREEAYALLTGKMPYIDVIVAAADVHTGAMIAFVPSSDDLAELVLDDENAEPLEQLHCTAIFLGDADEYDDEMRTAIHAEVARFAQNQPVILGDVFGYSVWNPDGEACLVADVGGVDLEDAQGALLEMCDDLEIGVPEQHVPWRPHVTLAYAEDPRTLMTDELMSKTGPITFNVVRVAFGGVVTDYPLDAVTAAGVVQHVFHLPGKHDQKAHGHKTTISPGDRAGFDKKMKRARTGDSARKKIGNSDDMIGRQVGYGSWDTTDAVLTTRGIEDYQVSAFHLNEKLRYGDKPLPTTYDSEGVGTSYHGRAALESFDTAMSSPETRIKKDVVLERGIRDPHRVFGDDWTDGGGNEGLTWDDDAFVSTTFSSSVASHFGTTAHSDHIEGTPVHMRMYVPEGTHGFAIGQQTSLPDYAWEDEVVLDRGMRFRIMNDNGIGPDGVHRVDVEVLGHPEGGPARVLPSGGFGWMHSSAVVAAIDPATGIDPIAAEVPRFIDIGPEVRVLRFAVFVDDDGVEHAPDLKSSDEDAEITASAETVFHLAGQHDQATHGRGGLAEHASASEVRAAQKLNNGKRLDLSDNDEADIHTAIQNWTRSSASPSGIGAAMQDPHRTGADAAFVRTVAAAPADAPTLYRGMHGPLRPQDVPSEGDVFDLGPTSFTQKLSVADEFMRPHSHDLDGGSATRIKVKKKSRALRVDRHSLHPDEKEYVGMGRYRVTSSRTTTVKVKSHKGQVREVTLHEIEIEQVDPEVYDITRAARPDPYQGENPWG